MKQPLSGGVISIAISYAACAILCAAGFIFALVLADEGVFARHMAPKMAGAMEAILKFVAAGLALVALDGAITAYGLFARRNWGRVLALWQAWISAVLCAMAALPSLLLASNNFFLANAVLHALAAAGSVWVALYLDRPNVRAQFIVASNQPGPVGVPAPA